MTRQRLEKCVYCGATGNLTDEHAPPKLVFPEPRPSDLITVRACLQCNRDGSKDAEYFRLCLCMNPFAKDMPSVVALKPAVQRSLQRPTAAGFRRSLVDALDPVDSTRLAFNADMARIHSVIRRIAQCLYLHETGKRIPDSHVLHAASIESMKHFDPDRVARFREEVVIPLSEQTPRVFADGQFSYAFLHTEKLHTAICGMLFYGILPYVALIADRSEV